MSSPKKLIRRIAPSGMRLWTYDSIRVAINDCLRGDMSLPTALMRSMMCDSSFVAAINKRVSGLLKSELTLIGDTPSPTSRDIVVKESITRYIFQILNESELEKIYRSWLNLGVGIGQLITQNIGGLWVPKLMYLSPEWLRWDSYKECWMYATQDGERVVEPGDGQWFLLESWTPGETSGFIPQLGEVWAHKRYALRSWVDWVDNSGYPITKATFPAGSDPQVNEDFISDVATSREAKTIGCPEGFDVELLGESAPGGYQGAKEIVEYVDRKYLVSILGGNLSSEITGGGSYAAAVTHSGIEMGIARRDSQFLSTVIRDQVLNPAVQWNFPGADVPWVSWKLEQQIDPTQRGAELNAFAQFVSTMKSVGLNIENLDEISQIFGVTLKGNS